MNLSENATCVRCIISGKVQGVFFRASTCEQALRLNLKGHAKNLSNGNVEVIASGQQLAVNQLEEWLRRGPKNSHVINVECETLSYQQAMNYQLYNFKIL